MRHKYEFEKYGERSLRVLWEWAINFSLWCFESHPTWVKDESHVSVMRSYRGEGCPGARGHLDQTHLPTTTSSYSPPLPSSLTNPEHSHQQKITKNQKNSASFAPHIFPTHVYLLDWLDSCPKSDQDSNMGWFRFVKLVALISAGIFL